MLPNVQAIILAGGISERFQTGKTKFIEKICGKEMILYPVDLMNTLGIPTTIVIALQSNNIKDVVLQTHKHIQFITQHETLGSGHAAQLTQSLWQNDHILIMNGDIPLVTEEIINKLYHKHIKMDADISFITAHTTEIDNTKSSRVIFDNNHITVREEPDNAIDNENQCCISAGIYLAKRTFLEQHITKISKNTFTGEYYLPELIHIASKNHCKIITTQAPVDLMRSIETIADLWAVEHIKRSELLSYWMDHGVRFANTFSLQLDATVHIHAGVNIGTGALLLGNTTIKKRATIGAYAHIQNSIIEEDVIIPDHIIITNSIITKSMHLKPFTHIDGNSTKNKNDILFAGALKSVISEQHNF